MNTILPTLTMPKSRHGILNINDGYTTTPLKFKTLNNYPVNYELKYRDKEKTTRGR